MGDKTRWPREEALAVAEEIYHVLKPATDRITIAGSLRRGKESVGDVEILYIPKFQSRKDPDALLGDKLINLADEEITALENSGMLERRKNVKGSEVFGAKNKLMRHRKSGIPVDLFSALPENWWNYLVCRTGPAESNVAIAQAAQKRGWKWNPYGVGFTRLRDGEVVTMNSEEEVFAFVGLRYTKPEERR